MASIKGSVCVPVGIALLLGEPSTGIVHVLQYGVQPNPSLLLYQKGYLPPDLYNFPQNLM